MPAQVVDSEVKMEQDTVREHVLSQLLKEKTNLRQKDIDWVANHNNNNQEEVAAE